MGKTYQLPKGALVKSDGSPTPAGRAYLIAIQKLTQDVNALTNLDSGTSYTNDQLRDAHIALLAALQG